MTNPFDHHEPTSEQSGRMQIVTSRCKSVYEQLLLLKPSEERTMAIRKLQECRMWANIAILGITLPSDTRSDRIPKYDDNDWCQTPGCRLQSTDHVKRECNN